MSPYRKAAEMPILRSKPRLKLALAYVVLVSVIESFLTLFFAGAAGILNLRGVLFVAGTLNALLAAILLVRWAIGTIVAADSGSGGAT